MTSRDTEHTHNEQSDQQSEESQYATVVRDYLRRREIRRDMPSVGEFSFPILDAPREIRDIFYAKWLEADKWWAMDDEQYEHWDYFRGDEENLGTLHSNPCFYMPFRLWREDTHWRGSYGCPEGFTVTKHYYMPCTASRLWSMNRQMREEAKDMHFSQRLLLELDHYDQEHHDDCMEEFDNWVERTPDSTLQMIRKLHILVKCALVAKSTFANTIKAAIPDHNNFTTVPETPCAHATLVLRGSFNEDDALFKLELDSDKKILRVRSFCKLIAEQTMVVRSAIRKWEGTFQADKHAFNGLDLLEVVRILKGVEENFKNMWTDPQQHSCIPPVLQPGDHQSTLSQYGWMLEADEGNMVVVQAKVAEDSAPQSKGPQESGSTEKSDMDADPPYYYLRDGYDLFALRRRQTSRSRSEGVRGVAYNNLLVEITLQQRQGGEQGEADIKGINTRMGALSMPSSD